MSHTSISTTHHFYLLVHIGYQTFPALHLVISIQALSKKRHDLHHNHLCLCMTEPAAHPYDSFSVPKYAILYFLFPYRIQKFPILIPVTNTSFHYSNLFESFFPRRSFVKQLKPVSIICLDNHVQKNWNYLEQCIDQCPSYCRRATLFFGKFMSMLPS